MHVFFVFCMSIDLAEYRATRGRPRGFAAWNPRAATLATIDAVKSVLDEYRDHLPLSLRQVFYRLVAMHGYPKTEKDYSRLGEYLNRARRARLIAFDAIRDDGFQQTGFVGWDSPQQCWNYLRREAESFRIDRQTGQAVHLVVWCEAAGMVPQLERVCDPYSVPVYSSGGFDSTTARHRIAAEFSRMDSVRVLHLGDHDPSGVHVFCSLDEDIQAFLSAMGGRATFTRLAVLPEHVERYHLPTAPAKTTDRRTFHGLTVQCEALPPDALADMLKTAITAYLDESAYRSALHAEYEGRQWLLARLGGDA
jgi:hypothetical protein